MQVPVSVPRLYLSTCATSPFHFQCPSQCQVPTLVPVPRPRPNASTCPGAGSLSQCLCQRQEPPRCPVPSRSRQCGWARPRSTVPPAPAQCHQHLHSSPCHLAGKQQGPCRSSHTDSPRLLGTAPCHQHPAWPELCSCQEHAALISHSPEILPGTMPGCQGYFKTWDLNGRREQAAPTPSEGLHKLVACPLTAHTVSSEPSCSSQLLAITQPCQAEYGTALATASEGDRDDNNQPSPGWTSSSLGSPHPCPLTCSSMTGDPSRHCCRSRFSADSISTSWLLAASSWVSSSILLKATKGHGMLRDWDGHGMTLGTADKGQSLGQSRAASGLLSPSPQTSSPPVHPTRYAEPLSHTHHEPLGSPQELAQHTGWQHRGDMSGTPTSGPWSHSHCRSRPPALSSPLPSASLSAPGISPPQLWPAPWPARPRSVPAWPPAWHQGEPPGSSPWLLPGPHHPLSLTSCRSWILFSRSS